jgi:Domain of unknown function (DUF1707)
MAADPRIRASDDDRERVVTLLREHHAAGRLTVEEFNERLDKAYQAKTIGELDELLADLPGIDLYRLPDASLPRYRGSVPGASSRLAAVQAAGAGKLASHGRFAAGWQAAWGTWLSVTVLCFVIWAISGFGYPWPLWVAGPWGAVMFGGWVVGRGARGGSHNRKLRGGHDQIGGGGDA